MQQVPVFTLILVAILGNVSAIVHGSYSDPPTEAHRPLIRTAIASDGNTMPGSVGPSHQLQVVVGSRASLLDLDAKAVSGGAHSMAAPIATPPTIVIGHVPELHPAASVIAMAENPPSPAVRSGPPPIPPPNLGVKPEQEMQESSNMMHLRNFACGLLVALVIALLASAISAYTCLEKQKHPELGLAGLSRSGSIDRLAPSRSPSPNSASAASGVIIEAETIRQRYKRLFVSSGDVANDGRASRDRQTLVHTLLAAELERVLRTRFNEEDNCKCAVGPAGLKEVQAVAYLEAHGPNRITPPEQENPLVKFLKLTFLGVFNILLWACVIAEFMLFSIKSQERDKLTANGAQSGQRAQLDDAADLVTPCILVFVIVSAAALQWYTEMQAESMMEAVQQMQSTERVRTVRRTTAGERLDEMLDPLNLVPGDVIYLEAGHRVPADVRILHCTDGMEVDNSALTGESLPETRRSCVEASGTLPMEARCLAFSGTTILKGNATCMVYATGDATFLGTIASGIKRTRTLSTLEIQIEHFVHTIACVAVGIGLLSFVANMVSREHPRMPSVLSNSCTALFAQVPEGLLPTVTISLMIASRQLSQRSVLVRKLDAVETLGCVNVICSDKTGTLTTGKMSVTAMVVPGTIQDQKAGSAAPQETDVAKVAESLQRLMARTAKLQVLESIMREGGAFGDDETEGWNHQALCICGVLNNGAILQATASSDQTDRQAAGPSVWSEHWKATGSPTEVAIFRASVEAIGGPARALHLRGEYTTAFEIPFNSENKWMLTIHSHPRVTPNEFPYQMVLKGAPERVLHFCNGMEASERQRVELAQKGLMDKGLRVLCYASRPLARDEVRGEVLQGTCANDVTFPMEGFRFVGLFGIEDPPKSGVAEAVRDSQDAGVKVVMVTGDHPDTAKAIASRVNIVPRELPQGDATDFCAIQGSEVDKRLPRGETFSSQDPADMLDWWQKAVLHTRVFARVSPIHKQVIVQAYQYFGQNGAGEIVAMTGDGVNDAPALKQAEVGVAMGIRGTEVAKDAADIVLLDDNFAAIVKGMEQGRLASDNLQKSIMYTLCSKVPQAVPSFLEIAGVPLALNVAQVLLIDIGTDIWTAITYAAQPPEASLMRRPPRHPRKERMVNWRVLIYSYCYMGLMQTTLCWFMFFLTPGVAALVGKKHIAYTAEDVSASHRGMTVYYWTLLLGQLAAAISTTTKDQRVFGKHGYGLPNHILNFFLLCEIVVGLLAIYWPPMQQIFDTSALERPQLLCPIAAFFFIVFADEVRKAFVGSQ